MGLTLLHYSLTMTDKSRRKSDKKPFEKAKLCFFFFLRFYYLEREGREKERVRNISVWLPLAHPQPGTWPAAQACALTRPTGNLLVCGMRLNPLSHIGQGWTGQTFDQFLWTVLEWFPQRHTFDSGNCKVVEGFAWPEGSRTALGTLWVRERKPRDAGEEKRKANGTAPNKPLTYASSLQGAGSPVSLKPFAAAPPLGHLKAACVQSCGGFACATCLRVPCVMKLFH